MSAIEFNTNLLDSSERDFISDCRRIIEEAHMGNSDENPEDGVIMLTEFWFGTYIPGMLRKVSYDLPSEYYYELKRIVDKVTT